MGMPLMMPDREPDAFEKGVRFGCGVLFAVPVGLYGAWDMAGSPNGWELAGVAAFALGFGFLAMRYGDAFWHLVSRVFTGF